MFICRHVLLRAYIPRHTPILHAARRPLSRALPPSGLRVHAAAYSKPSSVGESWTTQQGAEPARDEDVTQLQGTGEEGRSALRPDDTPLFPPWLLDETAVQAEATDEEASYDNSVEAYRPDEDPLDAYLASREDGGFFRSTVNDSQRLLEVLEAAQAARRRDVIRLLVVDVVENGHFLTRTLRIACIERLLLLSTGSLLSKEQALILFQSLESFARLIVLSDAACVIISEAILAKPRNPALDSQLLDIIATLLLNFLDRDGQRTREPMRSKDVSVRAIHALYLLAYDLAAFGMHRRSLDVMQALVQAKKLSSSAMQRIALTAGDFADIVLSTLIRSSASWGWRKPSDDLIQRVLPTTQSIKPQIGALAVEVLRLQVVHTTAKSIGSAAAIIIQLMERCSELKIPQAVLQAFYEGAQRHRLAELAEQVYTISQSDLVRHEHQHAYLPPAKGALHWFLRYLINTQRNSHLPRVLAWQLVDEKIPIIQQDRGLVIAMLAQQGLASQARALWERYAVGKERDVVVGNSGTMLRLVSLFVSLSKRSEDVAYARSVKELAESQSQSNVVDAATAIMAREGDAEHVTNGHSRTSSPVAGLTHSSEADLKNVARYELPGASLQTSVVAKDESGMPGTQVADRSLPEEDSHALVVDGDPKVVNEDAPAARAPDGDLPAESDPSLPLSAEATEAGEREQQVELSRTTKSTPGEFLDFAERVFNAFRRSRAPLERAHHWELNALARASFILGRLEYGLQVFKLMFRMRYIPDLRDINVAVSILAEHNPTAGANIIERMVRMGIEPDAVTFGSVIHHAIIHGDMPLTTSLIRRARDLGVSGLSYKTVGTLIRAAATVPDEDGRLSPRAQLRNTTELVDTLLLARRVPSPNMGRDCVRVALRADDPSAAFRFWQLLMKDKAEWGDESQARTRQMIARRIRTHYNEGQLDEATARSMLYELKARFYVTRDAAEPLSSRHERRELDD